MQEVAAAALQTSISVCSPEVHVVVVPCEPLCANDGCHQAVVSTGCQLAEGPGEKADPAKLILDLQVAINKFVTVTSDKPKSK
jgi:hypothetical protein